jgi:hypothetical protein
MAFFSLARLALTDDFTALFKSEKSLKLNNFVFVVTSVFNVRNYHPVSHK